MKLIVFSIIHKLLSASGHYIAHLFEEDENGIIQSYVANDSFPVTTLESQIDDRMTPERSSLFVYKKLPDAHEEKRGNQGNPAPEDMDVDDDVFMT